MYGNFFSTKNKIKYCHKVEHGDLHKRYTDRYIYIIITSGHFRFLFLFVWTRQLETPARSLEQMQQTVRLMTFNNELSSLTLNNCSNRWFHKTGSEVGKKQVIMHPLCRIHIMGSLYRSSGGGGYIRDNYRWKLWNL